MASNEPPTDTATALRGGIYPTFRLQDEEYGIAILKIKEIIGLMEINPIPKTPSFVKGVINIKEQGDSDHRSTAQVRTGTCRL